MSEAQSNNSNGNGNVRVAIFGNRFARDIVLPCLSRIDGVELVGLSSPNQERAHETAQLFGIPHVTADHHEMLEKAKPDLVFVAVPPALHAPMSIDALRAGSHVVCEKPMGLNVEECRQMAAVAQETGRIALIDHELRFLPHIRALRRMLQDVVIGCPRRVSYTVFSNTRRSSDATWSWWADAEQGGGAWKTMGVHMLDMLQWLFGAPLSVARGRLAVFNQTLLDPETNMQRPVTADEYASAVIPFAAPAQFGTSALTIEANILVSMAEARRWHEIEITGEKGTLRFSEHGPLEICIDGQWSVVDVEDDLPDLTQYGIHNMYWSRGFFHFARRLIPAIARGEAPEGAATFADGLRTQEILEQAEMLQR